MIKKGYDAVFRTKAVHLAEEIGTQRASAILGISARSLQLWKKLPLNGEPVKKELNSELQTALTEADEAKKELKRLKKENEELKTANLILREIASVFSKDRSKASLERSLNSKCKK